MAQIVRGQLRLEMQPVDVVAATHSALESVRPTAAAKRQTIIVDLPEKPAVVGTYDTAPAVSGPTFQGCWGAYIFPGTNLIIASDMQTGLSMVEYVPR